jgi:hypothetical protein
MDKQTPDEATQALSYALDPWNGYEDDESNAKWYAARQAYLHALAADASDKTASTGLDAQKANTRRHMEFATMWAQVAQAITDRS